MDTLDLADEDLNRLYRLHTGFTYFEDSDESSTVSESTELFDINEPPLYTYEELKANLGGFQPENDRACNTKNVSTGAQESQDHNTADIDLTTVKFVCYICNLAFWARDALLSHKTNFPHCQLYKMKADLLSQGIISEYWVLRRKKYIYCCLCDVCMQAPLPVADHLNSRGHRELFEQWTKQQMITKKVDRKFYCDICDFTLDGTSEIELHYQGKIHIKQAAQHLTASEKNAKWYSDNAASDTIGESGQDNQLNRKIPDGIILETQRMFYCYACRLKCTSQNDLDSHCEEVLHKKVAKLKHFIVLKGISQAEYWRLIDLQLSCVLCNVMLKNDSAIASHFKSARHKSSLLSWMKVQAKDYTDASRKWFLCDLCDIELDGTSNAESHYRQESHIRQAAKHSSASEKIARFVSNTVTSDTIGKTSDVNLETKLDHNNTFDCFACHLKFTSPKDLDNHCGELLHKKVVTLKRFIISKGIFQAEYWRLLNLQLECLLCNVMLTNDSAIDSHFKSKRHESRLLAWMQLQAKDDMHPNCKWFRCDLCRIELDGTTNAEKHYRQESHIRNQTKNANEELARCSSVKFNKSRSGQSSLVTVRDKQTLLLKDKVLTQMQQLVDNIYFSRRIPFEIALTYIKKYNQEIKNLQYNQIPIVS